jgi:hypothetical protein
MPYFEIFERKYFDKFDKFFEKLTLRTGGWLSMTEEITNSTEFVRMTGSSPGPDLPLEVAAHCIVSLNDTTVLLIGGELADGTYSKVVYAV